MVTDWRFDENNPYEDSFEHGLLSIVDSPHVMNMVRRKLLEIQRDPKAPSRGEMVEGKLVYIAKTGPVKTKDIDVDSLLIVYTLSEQRRLIQRVFVCKAATVGKDAARLMMGQLGRTLRQAIARAIANAGKTHDS